MLINIRHIMIGFSAFISWHEATHQQLVLQFVFPFSARLVHRLDRLVSGVMMIARNPDAAVWLAACFRDKSAQAVQVCSEVIDPS